MTAELACYLRCTNCNKYTKSHVVDSRSANNTNRIKRRRECADCGGRYNTYEIPENVAVTDLADELIGDIEDIISISNKALGRKL